MKTSLSPLFQVILTLLATTLVGHQLLAPEGQSTFVEHGEKAIAGILSIATLLYPFVAHRFQRGKVAIAANAPEGTAVASVDGYVNKLMSEQGFFSGLKKVLKKPVTQTAVEIGAEMNPGPGGTLARQALKKTGERSSENEAEATFLNRQILKLASFAGEAQARFEVLEERMSALETARADAVAGEAS